VLFLIEEDEICIDISVSRLPPSKQPIQPQFSYYLYPVIFKAQNQVRNIYFLFDFIIGGLLSFCLFSL
jgi:hypothetical protein